MPRQGTEDRKVYTEPKDKAQVCPSGCSSWTGRGVEAGEQEREVGGQTQQNPSGNELPHPLTHVASNNPIKVNYNYLKTAQQ